MSLVHIQIWVIKHSYWMEPRIKNSEKRLRFFPEVKLLFFQNKRANAQYSKFTTAAKQNLKLIWQFFSKFAFGSTLRLLFRLGRNMCRLFSTTSTLKIWVSSSVELGDGWFQFLKKSQFSKLIRRARNLQRCIGLQILLLELTT